MSIAQVHEAMSFKFFPDEQSKEEPTTEKQFSAVNSKQVIISEFHYDATAKLRLSGEQGTTEVKGLSTVKLKCVNVPQLVDQLKVEEHVADILKSSSDLKSGLYEGGFKTWECTYDLVNYVQDNLSDIICGGGSQPVRILDLGAGSGLIGLCVLELAKRNNIDVRVDFQDYNVEVIDHVTIPNTLLNFNDEIASTCRYFSGDWSSFSEIIAKEGTRYDLIFSSETIYNLDYFPRFMNVIKNTLGEGHACLYLAAKTFYFGVGGGTKAFLSMIEKDGNFEGEPVKVFSDGVKREIIRVKRKNVLNKTR